MGPPVAEEKSAVPISIFRNARAVPGRRDGVQSRVYAQIKHGLMAGAFVPGQVLTLRKFAQALGTSPMPVREAITQLVAANVLESLPNGSVVVPRLTRERFTELASIRETLECMAAAEAARKATPDLVKRLARINQQLRDAIVARDILACLATNQEFHFTLYEASGSTLLMGFIETLWLQAGPMMYYSLSAPDTEWDATQHEDVLECLRANDAAGVKRAIARDIRTTTRYLLKSSIVFGGHAGPTAELRLLS